jgi:hypothetical protein
MTRGNHQYSTEACKFSNGRVSSEIIYSVNLSEIMGYQSSLIFVDCPIGLVFDSEDPF